MPLWLLGVRRLVLGEIESLVNARRRECVILRVHARGGRHGVGGLL